MSYDIELCEPGTDTVIEFDTPHQMCGGTYAVGGTAEAWLNITYNYSRWYYKPNVFPDKKGIRSIYGLSGVESIPILENAIKTLASMQENLSEDEMVEYRNQGVTDYWMPTRENAIKPLYQLLAMAKLRPDGIWHGD